MQNKFSSNPFEFSRQQSDDTSSSLSLSSEPEVSQYKASQSLFNPYKFADRQICGSEAPAPLSNNPSPIPPTPAPAGTKLWFFGGYFSRIQNRDAAYFVHPRHIEAIPVNEAPDALPEACMRHEMLKWFPKLELQPQTIIESNYESFRSKLNLKPHPKNENSPKFPAIDLNRKVTFSDKCLTFVVYDNDLCRGENGGEKEENTQDIAPSPTAPETTTSTKTTSK
uniref:Uncharacterized protein n=1 Tax=Panagrolaimus davidi TaxID=227884 RepID=A0A914Q784_9BILA